MRILDVNDNELQEEDIDLELGHLDPDRVFVKHHDAQEAQERVVHYAVTAFYFEDGSSEVITEEDDPRVGVDDASKGWFHFIPQSEDDKRKLRGIDSKEIEDSPAVEAKEAWDEYEDIQRYILYTEEEIAEREAEKKREQEEAEKAAAREQFLEEAPKRLDNAEQDIEDTNVTVEDLILIMADLVGGEEETPEEVAEETTEEEVTEEETTEEEVE